MKIKSPKYLEIAEKIRPNLTDDFIIGKRNLQDFLALVQALEHSHVISAKEAAYFASNKGRIILSLGLYYLLPEIHLDPDTVIFQLINYQIEREITSGKARTRKEATGVVLNRIQ